MDKTALFTAHAAVAARPGPHSTIPILQQFAWNIHPGEVWAIVGPVASGKTSLAELIQGRLRVIAGEIQHPFIDQRRSTGEVINWPSDVIHLVSFKEESRAFSHSNHYYQQRFNFIEPEDDLTLTDFLRKDTTATDAAIHEVAGLFHLQDKLPLSLIKLSNGQTRRARLARALLRQPSWLILDEPFIGLDTASRAELMTMLSDLVTRGQTLTLITRADAIPTWVTHVLELEQGRIRWQGPREQYVPPQQAITSVDIAPVTIGQPVIELHQVNVTHGGQPILNNISWTVRQGERWALLGPNGSGKTTLLSMIAGDHPQVYANDVRLFGKRRGTGESIWDVKKKIGLVSPEIHLYFSAPLTARETIATGFYDVMSYRETTPEQDAIITDFLQQMDAVQLADRPFKRLSTGEQRLMLLLRGLVKRPPVLILDEPFQGLDYQHIHHARRWLDTQLAPDQALIFVSHLPEELPQCITQRLHLRDGVVVNDGG